MKPVLPVVAAALVLAASGLPPIASPAGAAAVLKAQVGETVFRHGDLEIVSPWSRGTNRPGQKITGAYFLLRNTGSRPIGVVSVDAAVAGRAEFRDTVLKNGYPQMVPRTEPIMVPPGGSFELKPGGTQVLLSGMTRQLRPGSVFKLTIAFDDGTAAQVDTVVWDAGMVRVGEAPR